ncbi:MAG: ZIP family metal transporter [Blastocatellia bacterium]|nr:ZIP family metal transporter [Blastocatellia bacterium]MCS7157385.1 ZIP family metal transporter [Blastocatellia bacterium]MCX7753251.1 ZIP family metal transporter [Blastocatellia bacterium]MDW8168290.1 ZIP family metal transporter [Acidobacteriota bacterium]MDW8255417.1 ZIP family metal transporter [Acidobacteriota bacterium]
MEAAIFGGLAALATIVGGWWVTWPGIAIRRSLLSSLLALGAGFLLAAVFLKVIPTSLDLEVWRGRLSGPLILVLAGYLLIQLFEHTVAPHFHFGEETHAEALAERHVVWAAIGGVALHAFFDGAAIAAGFHVEHRLGILIFIAIFLHKLPEGFTVASVVLASGRSRRAARWASVGVAVATLLGLISVGAVRGTVPYALPLSAGVTLYVAASDLIPEINRENRRAASLIVFLGVALYYMTEKALEEFGR